MPFFKVGDLSRPSPEPALRSCDNWIDRGTAARLRARSAPAGSVLLPKIGAAMLLRTRRITTRESVFDNNVLAVVPAFIENRYLRYWLETVNLAEFANPGPVPSLDEEALLDLQLPISDCAEQGAIADFLDAETARSDALIEKKRQMVELMVERRFALLSDVLIPSGCAFARLGRFASVQTGLTVDGSRGEGDDVVTRPYLRVANVLPGRLALDTVTEISVPRALAERTTLRTGDVLMTEGGDLDKLGRGTVWRDEMPGCLHQNHVFAVRTDPARLDGEYLALLTQSAHGRAYFERTGSRITNLASTSSAKVLDFPVPVLPLERQRDLVDAASEVGAFSADISGRLMKQIDLLRERRQALITAAVTGQFNVPTARVAGAGPPGR